MNGSTSPSSNGTAVSTQKYYLLGYNIQKSFSPLLHNTGFQHLGLPHQYGLFEVPEVDDSVKALLQDETLGGLSVTAPHKVQIPALLDTISDNARTMGSVNTVHVKRSETGERILHGENTDWEGISRCIERSRVPLSGSAGVVIGAGGAARAAVFALTKLAISPIYIVNRTESRAKELAAAFLQHDIQYQRSLAQLVQSTNGSFRVIVGCIPAISMTEDDIPRELFDRTGDGALVEMAYHSQSALVLAAQKSEGWKVFDGIDVLQQQAFGQFAMWTGQPAPETAMTEAVNLKLGRPTNPYLA